MKLVEDSYSHSLGEYGAVEKMLEDRMPSSLVPYGTESINNE